MGQAKMENIALAKSLGIGAAYQISVGGAMNTSVVLGQGEEIGLAKEVMVGSQYNVTVGDAYTLTAENNIALTVDGENTYLNITKNDNVTLQIEPCLLSMQKADGVIALQIGEGDSVLQMASDNIGLQVKDNSVVVNEEGVFLVGGMTEGEGEGGSDVKSGMLLNKEGATALLIGNDVDVIGESLIKLNC
ncbi:MAG: hypothetical protein P8101_15760 [Candidatus Thiodiazotropha sp.]